MILLSSTVFRHKVARERELGIALRRSCWFGRAPYRPSELRTSGCIGTGPSPLRVNSVLATPAMGSERRQAQRKSLGRSFSE
jgi:hypothetical protein